MARASGSTNVTVNFAADPNVANNESLANIVGYINDVANTAGLGNSVASFQTVLGSNYITLTSPTSGAAAVIKVTDNSAAQLLNLTAGEVMSRQQAPHWGFHISGTTSGLRFSSRIRKPPR